MTASEYADFLNQNAASDPDHLFDEKMASDPESACIIRFGTPEKCHYEVIAGRENFPVPYINEVRAAAYAAAMNLEQESHHEDFFLASNQNSFTVAINNPLAELSLRIPNLSSDSHYLESGSTMAIIGTLGMIVMGMVGREELVHEPVHEAPSRNRLAFETPPHYEGLMDNVRPTTGNTPPIITETEKKLPASERTMGNFQGTSVTVPEARPLEARGLTDTERVEQERAFWQSERDAREIRYRAHSPEDGRKISADDVTSVSKNTGASVSSPSQDSQRESTTVSNPSEPISKPIYRLGAGGWEEQTPNGSWEPTDRFKRDDLGNGKWKRGVTTDGIPLSFIDWSLGVGKSIENDKALLQAVEHDSTTGPDTIQYLRSKIAINEKRIFYNGQIVEILQKEGSNSGNDKLRALKNSWAMHVADSTATRGTKMDHIANALEQDDQHLTGFKNRLEEIIAEAQPLANDDLNIAINHLKEAIVVQRSLMEARVSHAQSLRPPYEELTPDEQTEIERKKWDCVALYAKGQSEGLNAEQSIRDFQELHGKALEYVAVCFDLIEIEAQKSKPNQQVIDLCTRSAELHQQEATAIDAGEADKSRHLGSAAWMVYDAAREAQKSQPNQQVIDGFIRSAELYQQAITALDAGEADRSRHLADAGNYCALVARKVQRTSY